MGGKVVTRELHPLMVHRRNSHGHLSVMGSSGLVLTGRHHCPNGSETRRHKNPAMGMIVAENQFAKVAAVIIDEDTIFLMEKVWVGKHVLVRKAKFYGHIEKNYQEKH